MSGRKNCVITFGLVAAVSLLSSAVAVMLVLKQRKNQSWRWKAQRKALRTASLSLILSFFAFTMMQSFFALSQISTKETYFERYQGVWDIMVTVKDTDVDSFGETEKIQGLPGIRSAIVYQKAMAKRIIPEDEMSEDMKSFGGFAAAGEPYVSRTDGGWLVNAPIVILDDASFLAYCGEIGIPPRLDGAVIWNQIRDVTNPDFRHPRYMPYVKGENVTLEELDALQRQVESLMAGNYKTESENRIRESETNEKQIQGMMAIFSGFCVLLAVIGIGSVFSNTLGFVRQRKREFARYMSVGMTPEEIRKMFCIEALTIAGRPVLVTLPLAIPAVGYMLRSSYVEAGDFLAEAPIIPIAVFMLAIWGTVALAYYLGWRNIRKIDLAEVLRDDTMM